MAVKMKPTVLLRVRAETHSHSRTDVEIRDLTFSIDEPVERGGSNLGPTPTDTALAALLGCTNVIGNKCAIKLGVDIGRLSMDAKCTFDRRGVTLEEEIEVPFQSVTVTVTSDGTASEAELATLAAEVAKYCPLSKLFENSGTSIQVTWQRK